ncbi:hypothetical protein [Streptomyces sp. HPF1205]|uniref:hypothetical protein n=1 Tax=Streptomyces sp. HPF1205 TaxID=2873262 RepID=UPI001CED5AE0|nr:hypothetical protein [Streptomyces sp. HPF1205]
MTARTEGRTRRRRGTAAAIALTAGITAGAAMLLSACGPNDPVSKGTSPSASSTGGANGTGGTTSAGGNGKNGNPAVPAASSKPVAPSGPLLNGTARNGLTVSDGTRYVVMNGTRVDFGTIVRDLAWSPDGSKAVFVDGSGNLDISNPDGSGRVTVARNPGGQTWSHPTWRVRRADAQSGVPALNDIFFAVRARGVSKLYGVAATAHDGTPKVLSLYSEFDPDTERLPQTGNVWPSAAGPSGSAVYANTGTGEVYIRDDYTRQQGSSLAKGSEPAMAPGNDGDVVFVRSVGGHDHLFLEESTPSGPVFKDLTPNAATDYTEPAFSADGKTIAARTPSGIVTLPANGSHAPVKVSDYVGLPAYRG